MKLKKNTLDHLKEFDNPNTPETRFYSCDYMVAFAEYYHKEKLNEIVNKEKMNAQDRQIIRLMAWERGNELKEN